MPSADPLRGQRGGILLLLLIFGLLAGGYAFHRQAGAHPERLRRDAALLATMARAREALIARAVTDDNRPGSLPCPDLVTDSNGLGNHPGDGKADMFTLTQCPSYVGWLPWVTLDLPEALDDSASRLWYALSPGLRDDDSAQPVNSDTATGLQLDGRGDLAALIIAPRAALAGQNRPSRRPADHLEAGNGNGLHYVSGPAGSDFNDLILPLSRRELMAAVEKRVAGEVRACLDGHAAAPGNPGQRYPWPAPPGDADDRGQAASRFGRIPLSQPGAGPQAALQTATDTLRHTLDTLARASDTGGQISALNALAEQLAATRNLADALFSISTQLKLSGDRASSLLQGLEDTVATAGANDRISRSEGSLIRERGDSAGTAVGQLAEQLRQSGIDAFPARLRQLVAALDGATDNGSRQSAVQASIELLAAAATPRADLSAAVASAQIAASGASTATSADAGRAAAELRHALSALDGALSASRANLLAGDLEFHVAALAGLLAELQATPGTAAADALHKGLLAARQNVELLTCGIAAIVQARDAASSALTAALAAGGSPLAAAEATAAALLALRTLTDALAANEAADSNLSRTSLAAAAARYRTAGERFRQIDLATPRPLQKAIVPDADTYAAAAADVALLAQMLAAHAAVVAPLAKAAAGSDPARSGVSESSLWRIADQALASLAGRNGSLALLQAADSAAGDDRRAAAALAETRRLGQSLLAAAQVLGQPLAGTTASAMPMLWLSRRCDFLQPGKASWWQANRWADSVFYQFSAPSAAYPGQLTINGRSGYRLVTLAAGPALPDQRRDGPAPGVGDFLEGANADPSRNPPATAPTGKFVSGPANGRFNDQLAY